MGQTALHPRPRLCAFMCDVSARDMGVLLTTFTTPATADNTVIERACLPLYCMVESRFQRHEQPYETLHGLVLTASTHFNCDNSLLNHSHIQPQVQPPAAAGAHPAPAPAVVPAAPAPGVRMHLSPNSRAKCQLCKLKIAVGAWRTQKESMDMYSGHSESPPSTTSYSHSRRRRRKSMWATECLVARACGRVCVRIWRKPLSECVG
jgi:hypothetical protein